ncbi:MAG: type IV secretory system conjugative DNA transfer family protein [Anaerolineae bacterium]|jgi:type IV secretory pathway TraG/TraD family ATPase VirD4
MIHQVLLRLSQRLPFYPPAAIVIIALLGVGLGFVLFGRSRETALFALAMLLLGAGLAVGLVGLDKPAATITWGRFEDLADRYVGPAALRRWEQITAGGIVLAIGALALLYNTATREKPGERSRRQLERDEEQRAALGSAHLCPPRTFKRWSQHDPWGWTLRGRFWGANGKSLGKRLSLSGEDIARGVAVFGPQGSGKTQSVILPAIADRMRDCHSLIVTDVQGELQPYVEQFAAATGHVVVAHNPSDPAASCRLNLCDWIDSVADAQAMAAVLVSGENKQGNDSFWRSSAINLLAALVLHYPSFGAIMAARREPHQMARELKKSRVPGVADLAANYANSMATKEGRLGHNMEATLFQQGLSAWAERDLQIVTDRTDLPLDEQLICQPTVLLLRCAARHSKNYGPYLGAVLRILTTRLDDLGQQRGGPLPIPVGLILEEFPALGRLDGLVRDINLVRKRRISVLTAAQSLSQFEHVYPDRGEADRLLAGLATKIVFGGCDKRTADFFSELSGQQTLALASVSRARHSGGRRGSSSTASLRGRALLLPDDVIHPARGHATVFAAYTDAGRADQAIFHARLTPLFQRKDWKLDRIEPKAPAATTGPVQIGPPAASTTEAETPDPARDLRDETGEPSDPVQELEIAEHASALARDVEVDPL